jgi:outer membrane biosynthesis protein TonB
MIDEAVGKILGMAMAYGVSALGLFLAYVNYRKRIVKADKVMTPAAWGVVAAIVVAVAGGVVVVAQLAEPPAAAGPETLAEVEPAPAPAVEPAPEPAAAPERQPPRYPILGIVAPLGIFLFATWVTVALYRHFSRTVH